MISSCVILQFIVFFLTWLSRECVKYDGLLNFDFINKDFEFLVGSFGSLSFSNRYDTTTSTDDLCNFNEKNYSKGVTALLVHRGNCSFYDKAVVAAALNMKCLIIMNHEDIIFPIVGNYDFINITVIFISKVDLSLIDGSEYLISLKKWSKIDTALSRIQTATSQNHYKFIHSSLEYWISDITRVELNIFDHSSAINLVVLLESHDLLTSIEKLYNWLKNGLLDPNTDQTNYSLENIVRLADLYLRVGNLKDAFDCLSAVKPPLSGGSSQGISSYFAVALIGIFGSVTNVHTTKLTSMWSISPSLMSGEICFTERKHLESVCVQEQALLASIQQLKSHDTLWLTASEVIYISNKLTGGIRQLYEWISHVSHLLSMLSPYSNHQAHHTWLFQTFSSLLNHLSYDSSNNLSEENDLFVESLIGFSMSRRDIDFVIDFHVRMTVFWDELGDFDTSQIHHFSVLMLHIKKVVKESDGKLCLLSSELVSTIACLSPRVLFSSPSIFHSSQQVTEYQQQQKIAVSTSIKWFDSAKGYLNASNFDNYAAHSLLAMEQSVTITPPAMMMGYHRGGGTYQHRQASLHILEQENTVIQQYCTVESTTLHDKNPFKIVDADIVLDEKKDSRLRVGFMSRFLYEHSVGRLMHKVISSLNSSMFDISLFCIGCDHMENDKITLGLRQAEGIRWVDLGADIVRHNPIPPHVSRDHVIASSPLFLQLSSSIVRSHRLDVMVYPELGMDHTTLLFARLRLARIQMVFWGHPISQGISTIDYFISSDLFYTPRKRYVSDNDNDNYNRYLPSYPLESSEQVILMDSLSTYFLQPEVPAPMSAAMPASADPLLGWGDNAQHDIFLLPHTIMKYSSEFIRMVSALLVFNPRSVIFILYNKNQKLWYRKLRELLVNDIKHLAREEGGAWEGGGDCAASYDNARDICGLERDNRRNASIALPDVILQRVVLLPKMDREAYHSLLQHSAIVLDPYPFGMGVTAFEAFSLGVPVVTLPHLQTVPSLVHGMLRVMNLTHVLSVHTECEYFQIATSVACPGQYRNRVLDGVMKNVHKLLENADVVSDWNKMLEAIAKQG